MPKMKSKSSVKKRFRVTKSGKLKSSRPARGHQHAPRSAASKRRLRNAIITDGKWAKLLKEMIGA